MSVAKDELINAVLATGWGEGPFADLVKAVREELHYDRRAVLTIERGKSTNLGRCYNCYQYRVTSCRELKSTDFNSLRQAGCLGYGQEYKVLDQGKRYLRYTPPGHSEVTMPQYTYLVTDYVDSSD